MISSIDLKTTSRPMSYASCIIGGDRISPKYWNAYFGVTPTIFVEKGEIFITPSGKFSRSPGRTNVWGYSTKNIIHSDIMAPHLKHLIDKLKLPRTDLESFIGINELRFFVSCYWWNPDGNRIPIIDPKFERIIRQSGGEVFIDEYPCEINVAEEL